MVRKSDLLWLGVAAFAGVTLFHTSYRVQGLKEELSNLDRQITSEQDGIQVLKAEWSFLNDPARLEQLAATHLNLKPITATQVATFDVLPQRPVTQPVVLAVPPATIGVAAPKRLAQATPASAAEDRSTQTHPHPGAAVTLASASVPAQAAVQPRKLSRPNHSVTSPTLNITHVSAISSVSARSGAAYVPAQDEIGMLMTRLGRLQ